jgi:hypothetical protein
MTSVPASIRAASEPQVNLLPPEVEQRRAAGRKKGAVGFGFGVFVLILGYTVYWASSQNAAAQTALQDSVARGVELQAEIDSYAPVVALETELKNARNARTYVGATELDFDHLIGEIATALPPGAVIETLTFASVSITDVANTPVDFTGLATLGKVDFTGQLPTYVSGADLQEDLATVVGFANVRVSTETFQDSGDGSAAYYTYVGTADLTALALSGRFTAAWLREDAIRSAVFAATTRLSSAVAVLDEATTSEASETTLAEAEAAVDAAHSDFENVVGMAAMVVDANAEVRYLEQAVIYGGEGAADSLTLAQATLTELIPILDSLAAAFNAWDDDAAALAVVNSRIAAAEAYAAVSQTRVDEADLAVAAGDEGADDALAAAELALLRAQYGLGLERDDLADAVAGEATSRAELDAVLVQVATTLVTGTAGEGA